ncbi:hypothetical protein H4Q26_006287 [Puccinia striiformis f. sp. tritici PST-130]|nr:hypothetical protein H4Q26_006287 [Puccinia striiformis f. sp. tritici PST-130]
MASAQSNLVVAPQCKLGFLQPINLPTESNTELEYAIQARMGRQPNHMYHSPDSHAIQHRLGWSVKNQPIQSFQRSNPTDPVLPPIRPHRFNLSTDPIPPI